MSKKYPIIKNLDEPELKKFLNRIMKNYKKIEKAKEEINKDMEEIKEFLSIGNRKLDI